METKLKSFGCPLQHGIYTMDTCSELPLTTLLFQSRNLEWNCSPLLSFKDGVDIAGISAVSYSVGKLSARARASRFKTLDPLVPTWGSVLESKPTHRLSFNLNRKFNKVVNSPWKSNLEYEYVLRAGLQLIMMMPDS